MFGNGNGKEWEKPYGNPMGMGIGQKNWEWEWEGMGIDGTGMGGSGNLKSHSRASLIASASLTSITTIASLMSKQKSNCKSSSCPRVAPAVLLLHCVVICT